MKSVCKISFLFVVLFIMIEFCTSVEAAVPAYEYSGTHNPVTDDTYWYIEFKSSGTFKLTSDSPTIDVFLVGGGGGGGVNHLGGGGGGGYTKTYKNIPLTAGSEYSVTIGAGGTVGQRGETTKFSTYEVEGGYPGRGAYSDGDDIPHGGNGGSGGGASEYGGAAGDGGSDGGNGGSTGYGGGSLGGTGQGSTTRAFGEENGKLYAGGGGGGAHTDVGGSAGKGGDGGGASGSDVGPGYSAQPNTGGGGGGCKTWSQGGSGGSGIVIIRGKLCTQHTGGTHSNGGKCTTCGVVYQVHSQSNTIANYTSTSTQHTPNYACGHSGCTSTYAGTAVNHSGGTHNNGGKCTACEYVYETHSQGVAIVDYTTTSTQHTPNYACTLNGCTGTYAGATELHSGGGTNDGYCIVCGMQYQTHGQSENVIIYKPTETQHMAIYECNLSGCTQCYLGTFENHSGATHENGGKCTVCGYVYEPHEQSTTVVSYTQQENGHIPVYSCMANGCSSTYAGDMELHDGIIELHIVDANCASCGWVGDSESDGNTYVLNIIYGNSVTTRNVEAGYLVTFGLGNRANTTYTVDTGNTVLRVYENRRQFVMPIGNVVITIHDAN